MRIRCMLGFHKWIEIKSGPSYKSGRNRYTGIEEDITIRDKICKCCGKLDDHATQTSKYLPKR